jgi:hypothetical protein
LCVAQHLAGKKILTEEDAVITWLLSKTRSVVATSSRSRRDAFIMWLSRSHGRRCP